MVSALFLCYILVFGHISGAILADKYKPVMDKALDFISRVDISKPIPYFFFKTAFLFFFNPLNSHGIPFFSNLPSKDKNEVMLRCSLPDWHQLNGNPCAGVCALKDMIQALT